MVLPVMNVDDMVDLLMVKNRAYNLLYALGEEPSTVKTLTSEEAYRLVNLAREVSAGDRGTYFHRFLAKHVPAHQLRYVATGRMA